MSFNPHVFYGGDCAAAFRRYQEILGGDLVLLTHGDLPDGAPGMPGAEPHHVMHAALTVGEDFLMGADDPTGDGGAKVGVAVAYTVDDVAEAERIFAALTDGGVVQAPFAPTFFSPGFGAGLDRWGVPWMVNTAAEE